MRRSRLKKRGRRAAREAEALAAFSEAVLDRAGGVCERCVKRRPLSAHHMTTNPRLHDPELGRALCNDCHINKVHRHQGTDWQDYFVRRSP